MNSDRSATYMNHGKEYRIKITNTKEINEHNAAVDRKKQEKKNRKYDKMITNIISSPPIYPEPETPVPTQGNIT